MKLASFFRICENKRVKLVGLLYWPDREAISITAEFTVSLAHEKLFVDMYDATNKTYCQLKPFLTYFWPMFPFYNPWKHQKTKGFLVFSASMKWEN